MNGVVRAEVALGAIDGVVPPDRVRRQVLEDPVRRARAAVVRQHVIPASIKGE